MIKFFEQLFLVMLVSFWHQGLTSEAISQNKLLWKLRPKAHKFPSSTSFVEAVFGAATYGIQAGPYRL